MTSRVNAILILLIDGEKLFRTKEIENNEEPSYDHEYRTGTSVSKDSKIVIQMWDDDNTTADDLMDEWTAKHSDIDGKVKTYVSSKYKLLSNGLVLKNSITSQAEWLKCYILFS